MAAALKKVELSIQLTGNAEIQRINSQWRKKNKATDVLSFPQFTIEDLKVLGIQAKSSKKFLPWPIGDIVISRAKAKEQADEKGISYFKELEILLVHGLLHLLGYDHELSEKEARRMHRLERLLLKKKH